MVGKKALGEEAEEPAEPDQAQAQPEQQAQEQPGQAVAVEPVADVQQPREFREIKFGENTITPDSTLRAMRRACAFYGLAQSGSKDTCWRRLTQFLANSELETALEVARTYQDDLAEGRRSC